MRRRERASEDAPGEVTRDSVNICQANCILKLLLVATRGMMMYCCDCNSST